MYKSEFLNEIEKIHNYLIDKDYRFETSDTTLSDYGSYVVALAKFEIEAKKGNFSESLCNLKEAVYNLQCNYSDDSADIVLRKTGDILYGKTDC